jgi:hypothetical protein
MTPLEKWLKWAEANPNTYHGDPPGGWDAIREHWRRDRARRTRNTELILALAVIAWLTAIGFCIWMMTWR